VPELPEVEVVRRGLDDHVVGRTITAVEVLDSRSVRRHGAGPSDFVARLVSRRVESAHRRGKYLWLVLDDGSSILTHLGMSGQALISDADAPAPRHLRITFDLDDGRQLRFADQRIFGGMSVSESDPPVEIGHDDAALVTRLRRRQTGVKRALLDQGLVSGVGNIYADEALWRAKLHYARNAKGLRIAEATALIGHVGDVMAEALKQGGTSFDALYVNVNGQSGYFDRSLHAYGQEGRPCDRCGDMIVREPFMNRSSYRCPTCQPRPRNGRW
jgi:formamidopyrimidine-DNA glycosylase